MDINKKIAERRAELQKEQASEEKPKNQDVFKQINVSFNRLEGYTDKVVKYKFTFGEGVTFFLLIGLALIIGEFSFFLGLVVLAFAIYYPVRLVKRQGQKNKAEIRGD